MTRWTQLWCLWKIHRSWRPQQWFLGLLEILLPAMIIWASLVYSSIQRRHLRNSPQKLPLYNGWPEYDYEHRVNEGIEVQDLAESRFYGGDIIWFAGTDGIEHEYLEKTISRFRNISGPVRIKVWEDSSEMLRYLNNPVSVIDWNNWRKWFTVVGSAKAAVLINETDYVIYAPKFREEEAFDLTLANWDQSLSAILYWTTDLLSLQIALEKSLFYAASDLDSNLKVNITRYNPGSQMSLHKIIRSIVLITHLAPNLGFIGCLSFLIPFVRMVNALVRHRESGTVDFLAINGMTRMMYYTSFTAAALVPRLVLYVPVLTFTVQAGVLPDVDAGSIFCVILLFMISLIPLSALMAELCSTPLLGLLSASSFYLLFSIFGLVASACSDSVLLTSGVCFEKWPAPSLLSPVAFAVGLATLSQQQLKAYSFGERKYEVPELSHVLLILTLDTILYTLITCAIKEHVRVIKYFRTKIFNFPCDNHLLEYIAPAAICVKDATVLLNGKEILSQITLSVDFAEKMALLGHNGAGKTTLLKVITGILPTTGTVLLNGQSVTAATSNGWVGYCPQEDVLKLIPDMTVTEVLELMSCIKGIPVREISAYAENAAAAIGLHDKRHELPRVLALGQRRKLAVSLAFLGNPKLVILDEPTAGLDPRSRRQVWDLIKKSKHSSCLYTTHLLEEARLGDKLAILNRGELPDDRIGSLASLKEKIDGAFQQLTVVKNNNSMSLNQEIVDSLNFSELEWTTSGRTLTVQLNGDLHYYTDVFRRLQDTEECAKLGIESFSLKMTGLEEFVVRLCDPIVSSKKSGTTSSSYETTPLLSSSALSEPEIHDSLPTLLRVRSTFLSIPRQIITICLHHKIYGTFRSLKFLAFQLVVPLLFIFFSLLITDGLLKTDSANITLSSNMTTVADQIPLYVNNETGIGVSALDLLQSTPPELPLYVEGLDGNFSRLHLLSSPAALNLTIAEERSLSVNIWFNASITHALPVVTNYLMNVLRSNSSNQVMRGHFRSYPTYAPWIAPLVVYGTMFACSIALVTSLFAGKLVNERANGARHLTQLCGVHDTTFYVAYGLADLLASYVVEIALLSVTCIWYPSSSSTFGAMALLLLIFTPCILAMNYSMSYAFKSGLHGAMWCTFYHVSVVHIGLILSATMQSHQSTIRNCWVWLSPLFVVVDGFLYFQNFLEIASTDVRNHETSATPTGTMSQHYLLLMYQLIFWSAALTLCESGYKIKNLIKKIFPRPAGYYEREAALAGVQQDLSIRREIKDVEHRMGLNHTDIFMKQVRKVYGKNVAVSGLYLRLQPGDCFGMLSPSGAGKTTALLMMAGLLSPTQGEVMVRGLSNLYPLELKRLQKLMGYLPQTDPLPSDLTVHQVILFYAKLKGVSSANSSLVNELLERIGLIQLAKKLCGSLSGGAKRLVALAIALLGAPPILLLDEPTLAMDTATRKKAWWMINSRANNNNRKTDTITILATHSMTEADSVCNRIGVLLNGHMSTIGSPLELKERFASGYYLQISTESDNGNRHSALSSLSKDDLVSEIMDLAPGAKLIEAHHNTNEFHLPSGTSLAEVVEWAGRRNIVDYSLSQMSFEHAYLRTVEQQRTLQSAKDCNMDSVPPLRISILVVGSRGDVQPFIAFAQGLLKVGHTVQIATHGCFRNFVMSHFTNQPGRVTFSDIGGDPEKLMQFMVEHPSMISVNLEELRDKRKMMLEIFRGCWSAVTNGFLPEVLIANPPTQVHVHIAEALQIPLQIHFTMPWSPTRAYLHPLAVVSAFGNEQSYGIVEDLMWLGMSDIINTLRSEMGLLKLSHGSGLQHTLKVPHVYCVSEVLVPKPSDWGPHITISGFWFLDSDVGSKTYAPPDDLADFLADGCSPIYIGFGSIVTPANSPLEQIIFQSLETLHSEDGSIRAIISPGWANLGSELTTVPEYVHILDQPIPHDWLFPKCSLVVHHGGAGTTAAGLRAGVPTVVIPFFGDQPFWGHCVQRQGVGSFPIPIKNLTQRSLVSAIRQCREPEMLLQVRDLQEIIISEAGVQKGVNAFHNYLPLDSGGGWIVTCVENQRWFPVIGWSATLSFGDPSPFSDVTGLQSCTREEYICPDGWFWEADWDVKKHVDSTDADGFEYSSAFKGPSWKRFPGRGDVVRRRHWFRRRTRTGMKNVGSDAVEVEKLRQENKLLRAKVAAQATSIKTLLTSRGGDVREGDSIVYDLPACLEGECTVAAAVDSGCVSIARVLSEHSIQKQTVADIARDMKQQDGGSPIEMSSRTDLTGGFDSDCPYITLAD